MAGADLQPAGPPLRVNEDPWFRPAHVEDIRAMELGGLEPPTSWVRSRRSPS
jgi:hypothetical protein